MKIVTSWGPAGYELYGRRFLESTQLWTGLDLVVYVDSMPGFQIPGVTVRHLEEVEGFKEFRDKNKDKNGQGPQGYNYRYDAYKFCAKVFAIHDAALACEEFVWLDADTITTGPISPDWIRQICAGDITYLDRTGINYAETGFIYFEGVRARSLIADMWDIYMSGDIFNYAEWTDAFVFSRLLVMHRLHGLKTHSLTDPAYDGLSAFENSPLREKFTHLKGARKNNVQAPSNRYGQLLALVDYVQPRTIVETGTWDGTRATQMAEVALRHHDHVTYLGYDLFEEATPESDALENNVKKHFTLHDVEEKLRKFQADVEKRGQKFSFTLTRGNTLDTLTEVAADFAFIDGGHSHKTVLHDWTMLARVPVVVFDDYYSPDAQGNLPREFDGVKRVFDSIDREKTLYPSQDPVMGGGIVHIAAVGAGLPALNLAPAGPVPIKVQAQDCMPKDHIIGNVRTNLSLVRRWVGKVRPHLGELVVVSGGPDIARRKDKIMRLWKDGAHIAAVKHSLPTLCSWGLDPDYLILLDPRDIKGESTHGIVRTTLLEHIPDSTKVLLASMSDPSVTRHCLSLTPNVWGWHAMTKALMDAQVFPPGAMLINGGTCAAWRMISLGQALGFSKFHLFGFDFSYPESQVDPKAVDDKGRPKFMQVQIGKGAGVKFWTTGELLAASQDAQHFFEHAREMGIEIYCYGEGIGPTLWRLILGDKNQKLPSLSQMFDSHLPP